jgi:Tfp pilus assembly protein PilZ
MRQYDRKPAQLSVTVSLANRAGIGNIHLDSTDISGGGVFLRSDLLFEVGDLLNLEIPLPAGPLATTARVVRVSRGRDATAAGMGIELTSLTPEERHLIQEGTPWQRPSRS